MRTLLFCFISTLGWLWQLNAQAAETWNYPYWHLSDYFAAHPEQKILSNALAQTVSTPAVALTSPPSNPVKIMIVQPGNQVSGYWKTNADVISQRLNELQIPFTLHVFNLRPDEPPRQQEAKLALALNQHPDYLITTLDSMPDKKMLDRVLIDGKTKLILQNITTPLKEWDTPKPLMYVGFDHELGTQLLADHYLTILPKHSRFSVVYWLPGYVSQTRGDTFINQMEQKGEWQLLSAFYTEGTRSSAYQTTERILAQSPQPSMIFAAATDLAVGISDALAHHSTQHGTVLLNGWGGGDKELEMLKQGLIEATVMRMNDDSGIAIAEAIHLDLQHQPVPQVFSGKMVLVTSHTPATELQSLRQHAFRYSDIQQ